METIRNNRWNRLFHPKEIEANFEKVKQLQFIVIWTPRLLEKIGDVLYSCDRSFKFKVKITGVKTLNEVFELHVEAWAMGFRGKGLGPSEMFRTKDILQMEESEVFLEGRQSYNIQNITFWEAHKEEGKTMLTTRMSDYEFVLQRYKRKLFYGIKAITKNAEKKLKKLEALGYQ